MKIAQWILLTLVLLGLAACSGGGILPLPGTTKTSSLPTAPVYVTPAPDANTALSTFLDAQLAENYPIMYALLSKASQSAINEADFAKRYTNALDSMSVSSTAYNILSSLTNPQTAQAAFHIVYHTVLFGDIARDINVNLILEGGGWKLQWDDGLILPELAGGKHLDAQHVVPARGDIYDSNGDAIVTSMDAYAIGLVAGNASSDKEGALMNALFRLTGIRPETVKSAYENTKDGLYVPVGEASADAVNRSGIGNYSGVTLTPYTSRFYIPNTAPHAVGYTLFISPETLSLYKRLGYNGSERVGAEGIEKWGENYLHGQDAASLYVDGNPGSVLAKADAKPADSIYMTINNDFQQKVQDAMDGMPGAIVVMEVNTGRILAMVSSPSYDPNLYDANNFNDRWSLEAMLNDPNQPTFNRATQGQYPLGSVFKIITMATALEPGVFTPASTLDCEYVDTEVPGATLYDCTWEDCQTEKATNGTNKCVAAKSQPSGVLTLPEGLMRSCDPWFYHIGYTLYTQDGGKYKDAISTMARAFGLGKATGIGEVAEATGNIPDPTEGLDATSIAIGQGKVLVTPLQVATFIAAVANGGTLYRPQLVDKVQPVSGDSINVFKPQAQGTLPVSADNLAIIQAAMHQVVVNPRGTGYYEMAGLSIPTNAKTGTAETSAVLPNAWFAGYSTEGSTTKPDIAVVVLVNNQGEGAIYAAPIFRAVMEIYFFGTRQTVYPGVETTFGVLTPDFGSPVTPTPTPKH